MYFLLVSRKLIFACCSVRGTDSSTVSPGEPSPPSPWAGSGGFPPFTTAVITGTGPQGAAPSLPVPVWGPEPRRWPLGLPAPWPWGRVRCLGHSGPQRGTCLCVRVSACPCGKIQEGLVGRTWLLKCLFSKVSFGAGTGYSFGAGTLSASLGVKLMGTDGSRRLL